MSDKRSHLSDMRVLLEACPPAVDDQEKAYAVLKQGFACYNSFHAVSIPDLQDAGEFQRVRQRVTNDEFAAYLGQLTEKPLSLYKVCSSCDERAFNAWLDQAEALGCEDIFLVGPDSGDRKIPGDRLDVPTAATVARKRGFRCGGIIIPTRRTQFAPRPASLDETERLLTKVRDHGLSFFTTQILYEGEWMSCLLLDLVRRMSREELPQIFLTFSPFVCAEDLMFSRKTLGVYIPTDVGRMLRGSRSMREASIAHSLLLWERISSFANEIGYPRDRLGVNVEYLDSRNPRNVDSAFELAEEFGRVLRKR